MTSTAPPALAAETGVQIILYGKARDAFRARKMGAMSIRVTGPA